MHIFLIVHNFPEEFGDPGMHSSAVFASRATPRQFSLLLAVREGREERGACGRNTSSTASGPPNRPPDTSYFLYVCNSADTAGCANPYANFENFESGFYQFFHRLKQSLRLYRLGEMGI